MSTQTEHSSTNHKQKYVGYSMREKLVPTILLSIFAPVMVFFFGPFEIYGNNSDEFKFVLSDFGFIALLISVAVAIALFAILILLRSRAYDIGFGLIFGISLMLFVQGNYLSLGMNSLVGDGVGSGTASTAMIVINMIIWCVVIVGAVLAMLFLHKYRDTVRLVSIVALVALIGMMLISFITISLTTDVYSSEKLKSDDRIDVGEEILTVKNLDTLAKEDNIVVFVVDRFDHRYYESALEDSPEIFDELKGFTYFNDYITLYPRTFPGIVYTVTGVETDFEASRTQYMKDAYSHSEYLQALKSEGYDINIYTDSYYGYENAAYMSGYTSNVSGNTAYEIVDRDNLVLDMIRLSLYRYLPFALQQTVGEISTPTFDKYVQYETEHEVYTTDMKDVYNRLTEDEFTFREQDKGFSFIHIAGCHLPNLYNENFEAVSDDERWDEISSMKQSFKIISEYIKEMKRMGVYDDATIIITGDHANIGSDSEDPYNPHITSLFVKPSGVSEGEMAVSSAQVSQDELFATILAAAGADKADDFGSTVFEISEDEDRKRRYCFQRYQDSGYEIVEYEIVGDSDDFDNWHIVNRYELGKSIYD